MSIAPAAMRSASRHRPHHSESCRVAPPVTISTAPSTAAASRSAARASSARTTSTTGPTAGCVANALSDQPSTVRPPSGRYTLLRPAPIRVPLPPASTIAAAALRTGDSAAGDGSAVNPATSRDPAHDGAMSQRWGVALAALLLVVAAAVIVAVLARGPRGAHARKPRRPRTLMVSGLVVLAGAAFAGAWAANVTSGPPSTGGPGSKPTGGSGPTSGGGTPRVPSTKPVPQGSPPVLPPPDLQIAQISGGRVGGPVRQAIVAATDGGAQADPVSGGLGGHVEAAAGAPDRTDHDAWTDGRGHAEEHAKKRTGEQTDEHPDGAPQRDDVAPPLDAAQPLDDASQRHNAAPRSTPGRLRATPPGRQSTPPRRSTTHRNATTPPRRSPPSRLRATPPGRQSTLFRLRATPPGHRTTRPRRQSTPPRLRATPSGRRATPPDRRRATPSRRRTTQPGRRPRRPGNRRRQHRGRRGTPPGRRSRPRSRSRRRCPTVGPPALPQRTRSPRPPHPLRRGARRSPAGPARNPRTGATRLPLVAITGAPCAINTGDRAAGTGRSVPDRRTAGPFVSSSSMRPSCDRAARAAMRRRGGGG